MSAMDRDFKDRCLRTRLRFYFITDHGPGCPDPVRQVKIALEAGATAVQYRNKAFVLGDWDQARAIRKLCKRAGALLLINDHVLLAKALGADGVHLGQGDCPPGLARSILGPEAIVGLSVSNRQELAKSDLAPCDYIGSGPVFATSSKADAKPVRGPQGLARVVAASPLPVVAIGGITAATAGECLRQGAAGVAVISHITRAKSPEARAAALAKALGVEKPA